jgi:hypothetical protein
MYKFTEKCSLMCGKTVPDFHETLQKMQSLKKKLKSVPGWMNLFKKEGKKRNRKFKCGLFLLKPTWSVESQDTSMLL